MVRSPLRLCYLLLLGLWRIDNFSVWFEQMFPHMKRRKDCASLIWMLTLAQMPWITSTLFSSPHVIRFVFFFDFSGFPFLVQLPTKNHYRDSKRRCASSRESSRKS